MEEKEREQLKERLLKMVVNEPRPESMPPMTMAEVMINSMSKPNLEPLLDFISQELDRAREEVLLELLEKKTNYKVEKVGHGYKVTQEYVLVSDIEKELSKLTTK